MKKKVLLILFFAGFHFVHAQNLNRYVNPFIGTANEGNTFPGPVLPWGMLSLSPFNSYDTIHKTAGASPYYYGNKYISGFTHMNMSGVGCGDMGIFCLMPVTGDLNLNQSANCSTYSNEKATPGYYSVVLDRYNIKAELTTTVRTGLSRYTFPKGKSNILLNLGLGLTNAKGAMIRKISDTEIEGSKTIGDFCGIAGNRIVYFAAKLNKKPLSSSIWKDGNRYDDAFTEIEGDQIGVAFCFETGDNEQIEIKLSVSFASISNAKENLESEQPGFDFEGTRTAAVQAWNKELSKIIVEGGTDDDKIKFYTAVYHALIHPGIYNDVNSGSAPTENKTSGGKNSNRYTIFSLWDTYRNLHPFLSLVYPKQQSEMVKTMLSMYKENAWLPKWELGGIETNDMVGDPAIPVIVDSYLRGIKDFDVDLAYEAMKHHATTPGKDNEARPGLEDWLNLGYIPDDADYTLKVFTSDNINYEFRNARKLKIVWGSVSTAMEYCIADWNLAQMAKALGKNDDYQIFLKRSFNYKNNFDSETGFVRPRLKNGSWLSPFDPASRKLNGFTEGASWNYSFMVPYNVPGLIELMGGEKKFIEKLNTCFEKKYFDITNEPDLAYPYLFNNIHGEEWRTQKHVHDIIYKNFNVSPAGLPGNDDCGTMSAWLIFSMMGLYPDCPGNMNYQLTSPVFSKITIKLDPDYYPGKIFVIEAAAAEEGDHFIRSLVLNQKTHPGYTVNHRDIIKGGILHYNLKKTIE